MRQGALPPEEVESMLETLVKEFRGLRSDAEEQAVRLNSAETALASLATEADQLRRKIVEYESSSASSETLMGLFDRLADRLEPQVRQILVAMRPMVSASIQPADSASEPAAVEPPSEPAVVPVEEPQPANEGPPELSVETTPPPVQPEPEPAPEPELDPEPEAQEASSEESAPVDYQQAFEDGEEVFGSLYETPADARLIDMLRERFGQNEAQISARALSRAGLATLFKHYHTILGESGKEPSFDAVPLDALITELMRIDIDGIDECLKAAQHREASEALERLTSGAAQAS